MLWKVASFALILFVSAQHSLPYSRIVSTHATYAALLASTEMLLFLKTSGFSFANALLADATLALKVAGSSPAASERREGGCVCARLALLLYSKLKATGKVAI